MADIPSELAPIRTLKVTTTPKRVVVVGAGLAGLVAASELTRIGHHVEILEASKRVGGRAFTLRHRDGRYVDLGAMRIPKAHHVTRFYCEELGLALRPFGGDEARTLIAARGLRVTEAESESVLDTFELTPSERALGLVGLWEKTVYQLYTGLTADEKEDLFRDTPETDRVKALDQYSLRSFLKSCGVSDGALAAFGTLWEMETSLHFALLETLRDQHQEIWTSSFSEIVGGTDRLPHALAETVTDCIRLGSRVTSVRHQEGELVIRFVNSTTEDEVTADWLIVAVPLGPLQRIDFGDLLPVDKADSIRRLHYDAATKVAAFTASRFWETTDGIFGGGSTSDSGIGGTWYPSDNHKQDPLVSEAPGAMLASYTWGQQATRIVTDDPHAHTAEALASLHPELRDQPQLLEKLVVWSWHDKPLSQGAYCFHLPGQFTELHHALVRPEGRILFAGEHASLDHAWMQGALESGIRAATAVAGSE
ncbi:MAG: flavin monoamine oxidase family protein [Bradymonadia bacterium]